jgi:hypothetical protein
MPASQVCRGEPLSKDKFQRLLASAWGRVWPKIGKGPMADRMGLNDTKTIDRAVTGSNLPEAHTLFNSLLADETALDEVLAEYGFRLSRIRADAANDMTTLSGLCDVAATYADALRDGRRVHPETLLIADKLRPHMPALASLLREAEDLRRMA